MAQTKYRQTKISPRLLRKHLIFYFRFNAESSFFMQFVRTFSIKKPGFPKH